MIFGQLAPLDYVPSCSNFCILDVPIKDLMLIIYANEPTVSRGSTILARRAFWFMPLLLTVLSPYPQTPLTLKPCSHSRLTSLTPSAWNATNTTLYFCDWLVVSCGSSQHPATWPAHSPHTWPNSPFSTFSTSRQTISRALSLLNLAVSLASQNSTLATTL